METVVIGGFVVVVGIAEFADLVNVGNVVIKVVDCEIVVVTTVVDVVDCKVDCKVDCEVD